MQNSSTVILVVAVALIDATGRVLLQRRRADRAHGGLWEFPGGKVEPGESLESAAVREIEEELGISLEPVALRPLSFASDPAHAPAPRVPHVILLYTCRRWKGEPQCHDAAEIGWFVPSTIPGLAMPPLDYPLADALILSI